MEAFYELSKSPATHDFVNWLVRVEIQRVVDKQKDVQIRFVRGTRKMSPRDFAYSDERKEWRVENLLMPIARLLPSVTDVSWGLGRQVHHYVNFPKPVPSFLRAPDYARALVSEYLRDKPNPVTITIRNTEFEQVRNSDVLEWMKVSEWLTSNGYTPVMVPDAERAMEGKAGGYIAAAMYPAIRLALYELSVANLMTTGGPMVLALMSDVPLMAWKLIIPELPCCTETHMKRSAMSPQDDWGPWKRLYWERDTAENIIPVLDKELPRFMQRKPPEFTDVVRLNA